MSDVTEHLLDLKGEIAKNSALLGAMSDKLDAHIAKTDGFEPRIAKLEEPVSAVSVGKVSAAFAAFTAAVVAVVLGILKLFGRDGF